MTDDLLSSVIRRPPSVLWYGMDLGTLAYPDALSLQRKWVEIVSRGGVSGMVLMVEHPPVFTLGQRGGMENLRVPRAVLERSGISVIQAERGGSITFHGPGQLVVYPVIDLKPVGMSVSGYVEALEEVMIRTAADWDISVGRNPAGRGVWVGAAKLGSIGIRVRRTVAFHGLALNVSVSLAPFDWINPCGLEGVRMTSMVQEAAMDIPLSDVRRAVVRHMEAVFGTTMKMTDEVEVNALMASSGPHQPPCKHIQKPAWLRRRLPSGSDYENVRTLLKDSHLHTVCQEARCPNQWECFSARTATFLIMGPSCTRNCRFCAVDHEPVHPPDPREPRRVAETARQLGLTYVVITSVTRDDLSDGGANHFAEVIHAVREQMPEAGIEVLIPDFQGNPDALKIVLDAAPDVLNHNMETVPRLYPSVRPEAVYQRSLSLIRQAATADPRIQTKSGLMLGMGETPDEVRQTLKDLRHAGCRILTLGQYLQPSSDHLPVVRFIPPDEFDAWKIEALSMGFSQISSGPFVRSSYHAKELSAASIRP